MFAWSCAQVGSPAGGPRDEDPPVVLESDPPNYSTRFNGNKFQVTFDEYIVLEDVNNELVVSPPMKEKPEVKLKKKTLVIEIVDTLKQNTTYTFNFGSAIKDLHEGNPLLNYEYVFSTGDVLDSLSVKGTLKYAEDLSVPDEPISILLYSDLRDSVPMLDIPLYVGRSNDSGVFSVNNLRPDEYKVIALKDGNNNFLFDLPSEEIAFLDSSLIVNAEFAWQLLMEGGLIDTTPMVDTTGFEIDTIPYSGPDLNSVYVDLLLFVEESDIQYITDYSREDPRRVELVFALPLTDSFQYRPLVPIGLDRSGLLEYYSTNRDSLTLWIRDSVYYKQDTLVIAIDYTVKDTTNQFVTLVDTLQFTYREKTKKKSRGEPEKVKVEKLEVATIRNNGDLNLNGNLTVNLKLPFREMNDSLIRLFHIPDSVEVAVPFEVSLDTTLLTRGSIMADWEPASQYRILFLPGAFASIYPPEHDTIDLNFNVRDIEFYGEIILNLERVDNRIIIQLMAENKVIRKRFVDQSGEYVFPYLIPGTYTMKFIHDLNENGKWDTGHYLKKIQPEPLELLPLEITVRSNWEHDVTKKLEK